MSRGLVIRGSRNIFTVKPLDNSPAGNIECRLKGKILKGQEKVYNPLAPGDRVIFEQNEKEKGTGLITALEDRRNVFTRFNQKGQAPQLLAANVDLILCVTTPASPPFRPRFLDRILAQAEASNITPVILCNKNDLADDDPDVEERLTDYKRIGYQLLRISARTGEGFNELRSLLGGKFSLLLGQSGVGKSSIVNALVPDLDIRVGSLVEKYDRGSHTTTLSSIIEVPALDGFPAAVVIDSPGLRRFVPQGFEKNDLIFYMKEFAPLAGKCSYGLSCSHQSEPGCKIMEAVAAGIIHEDRYDSFLRIQDELGGKVYND
ncbi:putative ribosome biogenesis GTPase RsgA [Spirochaetia bacterium]|nr:putative ribosome biogenesis GTPase RsgA [Spirochaetia bacterium]